MRLYIFCWALLFVLQPASTGEDQATGEQTFTLDTTAINLEKQYNEKHGTSMKNCSI
jgi:hypothetical protein